VVPLLSLYREEEAYKRRNEAYKRRNKAKGI
jgi:hypothetical protein